MTQEQIDQLTDRMRRLEADKRALLQGSEEQRSEIARLRAENDALRADAERGRWMIANAEWHRSEDRTHMAILVPRGSDLSCVAFRRDAIDAARAARGEGGC